MVQLTVKPAKADDVFEDMVRVHHTHRNGVKAGHIIAVHVNNKVLLAAARGALANDHGCIWIEDRAREVLMIKPNQGYDFTFRKARPWEALRWALAASNPTNRIAAWLGVLGLVLGIVGLCLGLVALF